VAVPLPDPEGSTTEVPVTAPEMIPLFRVIVAAVLGETATGGNQVPPANVPLIEEFVNGPLACSRLRDVKEEPMLASLHSDPRFLRLVQRVGP
jgi:hypothetical protein